MVYDEENKVIVTNDKVIKLKDLENKIICFLIKNRKKNKSEKSIILNCYNIKDESKWIYKKDSLSLIINKLNKKLNNLAYISNDKNKYTKKSGKKYKINYIINSEIKKNLLKQEYEFKLEKLSRELIEKYIEFKKIKKELENI